MRLAVLEGSAYFTSSVIKLEMPDEENESAVTFVQTFVFVGDQESQKTVCLIS